MTVEPSIEIAVDDVTELEGDAGTTPFAFTVSVSSTSIEVQATVATADGTAIAGEDYTAVPPTVLTFPQGGSLTQTLTVEVTGDTTVEPDETFTLELSSPSAGPSSPTPPVSAPSRTTTPRFWRSPPWASGHCGSSSSSSAPAGCWRRDRERAAVEAFPTGREIRVWWFDRTAE